MARNTQRTVASHPIADERAAMGKALRARVPRASQGGWKPHQGRRDPVDVTLASDAGRLPNLIPIRHGRMSASPLAFYRGSAALMAADLARTPTCGIRVQACGDAHLMNFGGFATPERRVIFNINDRDETLPAPFEWDLKRLAASVVIAAQHLEFSSRIAARTATAVVREYRECMRHYATLRPLEIWYDRIDLQHPEDRAGDPKRLAWMLATATRLIRQAARKSAPDHLLPRLISQQGAGTTIRDEPPRIFHTAEDITPGLKSGYAAAIARYRKTLPAHVRVLLDRFELRDVAMKVVGVGSVGMQCYVALFSTADHEPLFLQIKEARASVLAPYAGRSRYPNQGQRVVEGQRLMQTASDIFLGWARGDNKRDFYLRQLMDVKLSVIIEDLDAKTLQHYARMCAHALAGAHARSGDPAMISGYMGSGVAFDEAIGEFAVEYARQNAMDYRAFMRAIKDRRIKAVVER
jgi:uncharacterized protein (DUF2252 family)